MKAPVLADPRLWGWLAIALAAGGLIYVLSPMLAPFLAGAILAYVLNPLVNRLAGPYMPRIVAVVLVLLFALTLVVALMLVILPLLVKELRMMSEQLPAFLSWINLQLAPWLKQRFAIDFQLDVDSVKQMAGGVLANNQDLVAALLGSLRIGGLALLAFLVNLLLVPVVLFFLLRDWNSLMLSVDAMIPRHLHARARTILAEIDAVLAEFLRGQMIVMMVMSVYYSTALWMAGLEFALPIGIITGLLVIIPYIGAFTGILLGLIAAAMQFGTIEGVAWVGLAFGIGQALEGMVVTPLLVGERIGLHPVAVIFALLAFGQIFGFFGVLLALPASAALLVTLRHIQRAYIAGPLYGGPK
ncbi:MAG: AI-2E family transporter [Candidatus Parcubacteria bacterium]|nr:AI-2E family transporter [Burkholderiales bacterium]